MPAAATAKRKESTARTTKINLRVPDDTRDLIDTAAAAVGKTRTEFMLESARQHAVDVLLDQRLFVLDDDEYGTFERVLSEPAAPTPALKKLFAQKSPWER